MPEGADGCRGPAPPHSAGAVRESAWSAGFRRVVHAEAISDVRSEHRVKKRLEYLIKQSYLGFCFKLHQMESKSIP